MSSSELATERTPLINGSNISSDRHEVPSSLSELEEDLFYEEFKRNDKSYPTAEIIRNCVSFPYPSQETKDALVILLCLRRMSSVHADLPEVLEERNEPIPEYERHAFEELSRLLKPGMEEELDAVLWSSFYIRKGEDKRQSVISALFELPSINKNWLSLSLSEGILRSAMRIWKRGLPHGVHGISRASKQVVISLLMRRIATPRVLHLSELLFFVGYLAIFAHYVLDPPHRNIFNPSPPPEWRTIILIVYAASDIAKNSWTRAAQSYLTLLSFLFALPSTPGPTDSSYSILLLAFVMYFVRLHLPLVPSPVFLTPLSRSTPLSIILLAFVTDVLGPVLSFFMPAIFIAMFLLSVSLSDVFMWINSVAQVDPAPVNARIGFFVLLCLVCVLIASQLISVLLTSLSVDSRTNLVWDMYGSRVGLQTRRRFLEAVKTYSDPLFFPSPLNLFHIILIQMPSKTLVLLRRSVLASGVDETFQFILWTVIVLPVALVTGTAWAWGLAQSRH